MLARPDIPTVHDVRRPGMGIPASTRARVQALIQAARREPSDERTETCREMVEWG